MWNTIFLYCVCFGFIYISLMLHLHQQHPRRQYSSWKILKSIFYSELSYSSNVDMIRDCVRYAFHFTLFLLLICLVCSFCYWINFLIQFFFLSTFNLKFWLFISTKFIEIHNFLGFYFVDQTLNCTERMSPIIIMIPSIIHASIQTKWKRKNEVNKN